MDISYSRHVTQIEIVNQIWVAIITLFGRLAYAFPEKSLHERAQNP